MKQIPYSESFRRLDKLSNTLKLLINENERLSKKNRELSEAYQRDIGSVNVLNEITIRVIKKEIEEKLRKEMTKV